MRTELEAVIGCWSFNQVMAGRGMPEASQVRARGFFTTTLTFSGTTSCPAMLGGTGGHRRGQGSPHVRLCSDCLVITSDNCTVLYSTTVLLQYCTVVLYCTVQYYGTVLYHSTTTVLYRNTVLS